MGREVLEMIHINQTSQIGKEQTARGRPRVIGGLAGSFLDQTECDFPSFPSAHLKSLTLHNLNGVTQ
jgi:hypothetical protein